MLCAVLSVFTHATSLNLTALLDTVSMIIPISLIRKLTTERQVPKVSQPVNGRIRVGFRQSLTPGTMLSAVP